MFLEKRKFGRRQGQKEDHVSTAIYQPKRVASEETNSDNVILEF